MKQLAKARPEVWRCAATTANSHQILLLCQRRCAVFGSSLVVRPPRRARCSPPPPPPRCEHALPSLCVSICRLSDADCSSTCRNALPSLCLSTIGMLPFTAECCDHSRRIREEQARLDGLLPDDSEPGRPYTEPAVEVEVGDGGVAPEGAGVGLLAAGPVSPTRTSTRLPGSGGTRCRRMSGGGRWTRYLRTWTPPTRDE